MNIVNLAAYLFTPLSDLPVLRDRLKQCCLELKLKGTILLAPEGINIMLASDRDAIEGFKRFLAEDHRFNEIIYKESLSVESPFLRMWVKIKKEIITMGLSHIKPEENRAPIVSAAQLKTWLDEGKDVVLLDTRNDYEVDFGAFENAVDLKIKHFRHFPQAVTQMDPALKTKAIVTYCTGGVRCEKAAWVLLEQGFQEVYQLDGGILQYFAENQGAHYQGNCFVFDDRIAITPQLNKVSE